MRRYAIKVITTLVNLILKKREEGFVDRKHSLRCALLTWKDVTEFTPMTVVSANDFLRSLQTQKRSKVISIHGILLIISIQLCFCSC